MHTADRRLRPEGVVASREPAAKGTNGGTNGGDVGETSAKKKTVGKTSAPKTEAGVRVRKAAPVKAAPAKAAGIADHILGVIGLAAELSFGLGETLLTRPAHRKALASVGALLHDAREAAGLTVSEVSAAIDLDDPSLLERAEHGRAALPAELLLRLVAVLARNDPVPFLMQLVRNYSPRLWDTLEQLGLGGLVLHAGREHAFINIYRSRDAARQLTDAQFARVLEFTDAAFGMALALVATTAGKRKGRETK